MKYKGLKSALVVLSLATLPLVASDDFGAEKSLVGVELGYGRLNSDITRGTSSKEDNRKVATAGFKIGAQNSDYRITLGLRYEKGSDDFFDYITNYEVEGDYFFPFSQKANLFIGLHTGLANMKFTLPHERFYRTISNSYYGGNVGFNIHVDESLDFEMGTRMSLLDVSNTKNGVKYTLNNQMMGYFSLIFKYDMD